MSASVALRQADKTELDLPAQHRSCNSTMACCMESTQSDVGQSESSPINSLAMLPPCRICEQKASGFHYGANTCQACKGFCKRSFKKRSTYICSYDDKCDIRACKRRVCNACRFNKCIEIGMCKSAIKIGRYSYEKKTKIIKEVKRLELARQATLPTIPSSDNVVALSMLPQQMADNKYELVIEHILAAYQEHPLFGANFDADMKQSEEAYLAEKRLTEYMFGSMKPVTGEEHIMIYQSAGIDIDGRLEKILQSMPLIEKGTRCSIAFIKALPASKVYRWKIKYPSLKNRASNSTSSWGTIMSTRAELITFFWGETMGTDKLTVMHSEELVETLFSLSSRIQKLDLCQTETLILYCIALFFPDRCKLECPDKVEEIQNLMMETLSYFHKRMYPDEPHRLARCLILFPELRSVASMFIREKEHFLRKWCKMLTFPPLLRELCRPD